MATQSALPTRPLPASPFNECLAFFLLLVNMGATAFLNEPEASLVIGVLGVMTLSIIFLVVYQPAPITDKSRMRLLMLWAFGLMLLVMTGRAHSVDLLVVAPNLIFLSCIPLLVIGVSAPIRGFAWFVFPAFGLWMLMINLLPFFGCRGTPGNLDPFGSGGDQPHGWRPPGAFQWALATPFGAISKRSLDRVKGGDS